MQKEQSREWGNTNSGVDAKPRETNKGCEGEFGAGEDVWGGQDGVRVDLRKKERF